MPENGPFSANGRRRAGFVHRGDDGLPAGEPRGYAAERGPVRRRLPASVLRRVAKIIPGAERPVTGAGDYGDEHVRVVTERGEGSQHLLVGGRMEGGEPLGPVDGDAGYALARLVFQELVGHAPASNVLAV